MAPLGQPGVTATYTFDAAYKDVDLTAISDYLEMQGMRLAGTVSGRNRLEWPRGRFKDRTRRRRAARGAAPRAPSCRRVRSRWSGSPNRPRPASRSGPFSNHRPLEPVPVGGSLAYAIEPDWIHIGSSRLATPTTLVEFEGSTAYGNDSRIPFHVTSADWQESDRLMAGILTAFGASTNAIEIGGYGTFDGIDAQRLPEPAHRRRDSPASTCAPGAWTGAR